MVWGAFSYDHLLQLMVVNGTLNSQKYRDEILEHVVRPFMNSPEGQNMVLQDDNARPHRARIIAGLENSTCPLVFTSASGCRASENFDISSEILIFSYICQ